MSSNEKKLEYACLYSYSSKGTKKFSLESQNLVWKIKQNKENIISKIVERFSSRINENSNHLLKDFFNPNTHLIPVPSSSPLVNNDSLWVPKVICEELIKYGFGKDIKDILKRTKPIPKSSLQARGDRPNPIDHFNSIILENNFLETDTVILVDDVITRGSTVGGCADLLHKRFPNLNIKVFALARTRGFIEFETVEDIITPFCGELIYSDNSAKRED